MRLRKLFERNLVIVLLILLWVVCDLLRITNPIFIPHFSQLAANTIRLLQSAVFWGHILSSVSIIVGGFLLSVVVALPLGLLLGYYAKLYTLFSNIIELLRPLSPLALYPLFIYLFGIGYISKLAIVFWVAWIPLLLNTISGVRQVPEAYLQLAQVLGATKGQTFTNIIIPFIRPNIITGMRLAMGSALLVIVAAEMIGSSSGLGFFILNAAYTFHIVDLYSGVVVIATLGILTNTLFVYLEKNINQ